MKAQRYKANFTPLLKVVYADIKAANSLQAAVHAFWAKTKYTCPKAYHKDFVEWYVSLNCSTTPEAGKAYASRVATEAGFRLRAVGAGPKPAPVKTPFEKWLDKMPKKITSKERKMLLARVK